MEKYAEITKAMAICAGPDCDVSCPYHGKSLGGKSCRTLLLEDARAALVNEEAGLQTIVGEYHRAEAECDKLKEERDVARKALAEWQEAVVRDKSEIAKLNADIDDLEAANATIRTDRDGLKEYALVLEREGQEARTERDKLAAEVEHLEAEKNAYRIERNKLHEECEALEKKVAHITTDRDALRALRCPPKKEADRSSVSDDALKSEYKRGYLDAMEYCFRELCKRAGGGVRHE